MNIPRDWWFHHICQGLYIVQDLSKSHLISTDDQYIEYFSFFSGRAGGGGVALTKVSNNQCNSSVALYWQNIPPAWGHTATEISAPME